MELGGGAREGGLEHGRTPQSQVTCSEDVGTRCLGDGGGSRAVTPERERLGPGQRGLVRATRGREQS